MKRMTRLLLSITFALAAFPDTTELGDAALAQAMADIRSGLRLMCVAAHPDDEDGATLALYRKKFGVQTFAVISTRGEGGQNEIGPELYSDLAVIRTREMMRASKVTGAELHFLNLPEFGFSKSPDEAFSVWGHEETVRRMVRIIRQTRPHVIISNHGTQKDHGHHQAVGIALQEAFDAAADPARFPELEKEGLAPWTPALLYLRAWQPTPDAVKIPIGELDPVRGKTYAEIAADALGEHKSQGMGFFIDLYLSGKIEPAYLLVKQHEIDARGLTVPGEAALFLPLNGARVATAQQPLRPPSSRALVRAATKRLQSDGESVADQWRRARVHSAAAIALGLRLEASAVDDTIVAGQRVEIAVKAADFGAPDAESVDIAVETASWFGGGALPKAQTFELSKAHSAGATISAEAPADAPLSIPAGEHVFDAHFFEPQYDVVARFHVRGARGPIELRVPVRVEIAPRVTAQIVNAPVLVRRGVAHKCSFDVLLSNNAPEASDGKLLLSMAPGFVLDNASFSFAFTKTGEQRIVTAHAVIGDNLEPRDYWLNAVIEGDVRPALGAARLVDVKLPEGIRVGVVQSYDNTFLNVLEKLGIPHALVQSEDFTADRLDAFSVIIVDIRAYLVRADLAANNQALLDYVARGGTALVMYQKTEEWSPAYAPYPITLSRNRVTREDAPISVLAPAHAVFTSPNPIAATDWDGWIQERGLYFPSEWDAHYTPLIACNDPGETIPPGSLLVAKHGKGTYLYTSLGLYRQVRELHPGALRLFANMLALGQPR